MELSLQCGQLVQVLSQNSMVSDKEGLWAYLPALLLHLRGALSPSAVASAAPSRALIICTLELQVPKVQAADRCG